MSRAEEVHNRLGKPHFRIEIRSADFVYFLFFACNHFYDRPSLTVHAQVFLDDLRRAFWWRTLFLYSSCTSCTLMSTEKLLTSLINIVHIRRQSIKIIVV